jgi:hypothetical protein
MKLSLVFSSFQAMAAGHGLLETFTGLSLLTFLVFVIY